MTTEPTREITTAFDGACRGNPGPGGYGAILLNTRTNAEKIVQGREASTTNNRMELSAAVARHLTVTWQWMRGHAGHDLNERVDRIAAAQAERQTWLSLDPSRARR